MSGKYWAECYTDNASLSNGVYSQRFRLTQGSVTLDGVRTWIILINNPVFTNLQMKIYSSDNGIPSHLLYTSTNSYTDVELLNGHKHAYKGIFFEFDKVGLRYNTDYHLILTGNATNFDSDHYIAWKYAANDPVYPPHTPIVDVQVEMMKMGFEFALWGNNKWLI